MALRWTDSPKSPSPAKMLPFPKVPKAACQKGDKVFVMGWGGFISKSRPNTDQPAVLCEVVDWGYHFPAHKHCYFLKVVQPEYATSINFMSSLEQLIIPKYQPGTTLNIRDVDDRTNGIGLSSERQVLLEVVELKDRKIKYWIKAPPPMTAKKEKKAKWIDVEEDKLEKMAAAALKAKEQAAAAAQRPFPGQPGIKVQNSFSVRNDHAR